MNLKTGAKRRFVLPLVAALLCAGILVRLFGGVEILSSDLAYLSGNEEVEILPELVPDTPESTARLFYHAVNSGEYEAAWQYSLEPDWIGDGSIAVYRDAVVVPADEGSSVPPGWTDEGTFVTRMNRELGKSGYGIKLNNIRAVRSDGIDASEGAQLTAIEVDEIIPVTVTGHLLGACTIFSWEKSLLVLRMDDTYRVLLEGTKEKNSLYYQTWISDIVKIADLRKASPQ